MNAPEGFVLVPRALVERVRAANTAYFAHAPGAAAECEDADAELISAAIAALESAAPLDANAARGQQLQRRLAEDRDDG